MAQVFWYHGDHGIIPPAFRSGNIFLFSHFVYQPTNHLRNIYIVELLTRRYNPVQKSSCAKYSWAAELSQSSRTSPSRRRSEQRPLEGWKARGKKFMQNSNFALCNGKWLHSMDLFDFNPWMSKSSCRHHHFSWFIASLHICQHSKLLALILSWKNIR